MASADVVVIGAGLSGMVAAARLAEAGAAVTLVAKGYAGTHWGSGGLDIAAPPGAATPAAGVAALAARGHPYEFLAPDVGPSVAWLLQALETAGLPYAGGVDSPIRRLPTAIGGTRPAAIVPAAQGAALPAWTPGEVLVVAGIAGYKDFWPQAIAQSLGRERPWAGSARPASVSGISVELPGSAGRHNLNALHLAHHFDGAATRREAISRLARDVERAAAGRPGRVALPAVFGLEDHAGAWATIRAALPLEPFEVPLVPPSVPGMRLWRALRERIRGAGGRVQVGEAVARVRVGDGRVTAVEMEAAARSHVIRTAAVVLATGGLTGGGLVATGDGRIVEQVLGLDVEAPARGVWLAEDALDPRGHPVEAAGVRTDHRLRPLAVDGTPAYPNVVIAGSLLAGQRPLHERCRDGVGIASGWRAATVLAGAGAAPGAGSGSGARGDAS